jgi:hypothetical protein
MARPSKATVDYFPLDCKFGDSLEAIENMYGNDGFVVWVKLLQKLGRSDYHAIDLRAEGQWKLFYSIFKMPETRVKGILNTLAELECIDKHLWDNKIIYSENFVKRVSDAYRKRQNALLSYEKICEYFGVSGGIFRKKPESCVVSGGRNSVSGGRNRERERERERGKGKKKNKQKKIDPFINDTKTKFIEEYKKVFGIAPVLTREDCSKITELLTDIEDFENLLPVAMARLKEIKFDDINYKPGANWLLKDNNFARVINGEFNAVEIENNTKETDIEHSYNGFA